MSTRADWRLVLWGNSTEEDTRRLLCHEFIHDLGLGIRSYLGRGRRKLHCKPCLSACRLLRVVLSQRAGKRAGCSSQVTMFRFSVYAKMVRQALSSRLPRPSQNSRAKPGWCELRARGTLRRDLVTQLALAPRVIGHHSRLRSGVGLMRVPGDAPPRNI